MKLDFPPSLPIEVEVDLQQAGRRAGLELWRLELLGQEEDLALEFIQAVRQGEAEAFLSEVDWDVVEARYQDRRRREEGWFWQRPNVTPTFPELLPMT